MTIDPQGNAQTSAAAKDIEAGLAETTGAGNATAVANDEGVAKETNVPNRNRHDASSSTSSTHSASDENPPDAAALEKTVSQKSQSEGYGKSRIMIIMFSLCVSCGTKSFADSLTF